MVAEEVVGTGISGFLEGYQNFLGALPQQIQIFINLLLITLVVVVYAIFVWKFDFFISTRDILRLNLKQYNRTKHPTLAKITASSLYFLEYIIILPAIIFFAFFIFAMLLVLVTKGLTPPFIILISAVTILAIRILSYIPQYGESVAGQIAKIIPMTILVFSLTDPLFFNLEETLNQLTKIPEIISLIWIYFLFIVAIELILRILTIFSYIPGEEKIIKKKK